MMRQRMGEIGILRNSADERVATKGATVVERSIGNLQALRESLTAGERQVFDRLFHVQAGTGRLVIPAPMTGWVQESYGSVDAVSEQNIVKVTNLWSLQTSLFNPFRSERPQVDGDSNSLADEIYGDGPDPFEQPEHDTSEDIFGRIHGEHAVTASNLAKSDVYHGVIAFNEHNPWNITADALWDAVGLAGEWFERCRRDDPQAVYPLLLWNCLWKSGASIAHAHMQLLMTAGMHYGEIEGVRRVSIDYANRHGTAYFDDLFQVHRALGLGRELDGVRMYAHLTPLLSHECVLLCDSLSEAFVRIIHQIVRLLNEELGVTSFNLVILPRPLTATDEDWSTVPVMARIVDRGNPLKRTIDTGAMELFAASVLSTDPFSLGALLEKVQGV